MAEMHNVIFTYTSHVGEAPEMEVIQTPVLFLPSEPCHVLHSRIQEMTIATPVPATRPFLIGPSRLCINHWRRAAGYVERISGDLPAAYSPAWTAETGTVVVNAAALSRRRFLRYVRTPTGAGNSVRPPSLTGGSTISPSVLPQRGGNYLSIPYLVHRIRSNNRVPVVSASMAGVRPLIVTTTGNGPMGRQIYGDVVGQGASGEMNVMCSCHGRVLSPAAFVRHAGGTSSRRPMDQIILCTRNAPF